MDMKQNFLLLACISLLLTSCHKQQSATTDNSYPMITVSRTNKTVETNYSATIKGSQDVDIYPQVSGKITKICINEGATVKKGQPLFIIDQVPYMASVATARANVQSAKAGVANAQLTLNSKQKLYAQKVISHFDLQQAQISLSSQYATLAQARAEYAKAVNDLSYTVVKSPVNGVAGMITYKVGALVSANITTPLVSVSDDRTMHVYFSLTENQMLSMSRGLSSSSSISGLPAVKLTLSDGSKYDVSGKIDAVSGIVDKSTGAVSVRASFANPRHLLKSGSTGSIILPTTRHDCIVIPQAATYELQDKVFVYKVVNGKTVSTKISVFPVNDGTEYIVEDGLKSGDVIIAEGAGLLQDGMQVKAKHNK
jgi:membrane fusion protein (multidrug efflux system)